MSHIWRFALSLVVRQVVVRDSSEELAYDALREIGDQWEALHEARLPGARRRWSQRDLSDEQMALRGRAEQLEREEVARYAQATRSLPVRPGHSSAPLDVDVLSAVALITSDVLWWERKARRLFGHDEADHQDPSSTRTIPAVAYSRPIGRLEPNEHGPRLPLALGHADVLADHDWSADPRVPAALVYLRSNINGISEISPSLLDEIRKKSRRHASAVRLTLGLQPRRHRLEARCPSCEMLGLVVQLDQEPALIVHQKPLGCGESWPSPQWHRNGLGLDLAVAAALVKSQDTTALASSRRISACRCGHTQVIHSAGSNTGGSFAGGQCTATVTIPAKTKLEAPTRAQCSCTEFALANVSVKPIKQRRSA